MPILTILWVTVMITFILLIVHLPLNSSSPSTFLQEFLEIQKPALKISKKSWRNVHKIFTITNLDLLVNYNNININK